MILSQLEGLKNGYNAAVQQAQQLTMQDFLIINMDGDLEELMPKFNGNANDHNTHNATHNATQHDVTRRAIKYNNTSHKTAKKNTSMQHSLCLCNAKSNKGLLH